MSTSRRIACKLCRDRKVRCDGEQPACDRCRRAGETCVYAQTYNPTKADLLHTIETLKDRVESLRNQQAHMIKASYNQPPPGSAMSVDYSDCASLGLQTPSSLSRDDPFLSSPLSNNAFQSIFPDNQFFTYFPTEHNDPSQFQFDNMTSSMSPEGNSALSPTSEHQPRSYMPSLREVRALNNMSTSNDSPPSLSSPNSRPDEEVRSERHHKVNIELMKFCASVLATQAEMAGISSVVAEYLAWVRKKPSRPATGAALEANWAVILETLESRVQELHTMAETRHRVFWEEMVAKLKNDGSDAQLSAFEAEVRGRTEKIKQFFQESYDVSIPLPEQMDQGQLKD